VTTFVAPRGGRAFHDPQQQPCLLNLHGTVYHWLRSAKTTPDTDVADARIAMEQWWTTADAEDDTIIADLVERFRTGLLQCNPITAQLVRASELAGIAPHRHVALQFQHGDTGPDVSVVYHTASANRVPPELLLCKWAVGCERPCCKPLQHGDVDNLAFVTIFPAADGAYHANLRLTNGRRMTRSQWVRHLLFHRVPHIVRQPRVFQEFLLHVWNEVENQRLQYFRNCIGPAVGDGPDNTVLDNEDDGVSIGSASFIPAAFTGGALLYSPSHPITVLASFRFFSHFLATACCIGCLS
jgi:hypothetical protein